MVYKLVLGDDYMNRKEKQAFINTITIDEREENFRNYKKSLVKELAKTKDEQVVNNLLDDFLDKLKITLGGR